MKNRLLHLSHLFFWPLATTIHQNNTYYGNIKGLKKGTCISENLDNKLVAIDTIKWMETPLLKAI
jgi:hypothetical protein